MTSLVINVPSEYISLGLVMQSALEQASKGKGRERHAEDGEAYEDQIICEVARRVGLGYPLGQAVKKIYEGQRIGGERGVAELLGALNYVAAAVIVMREGLEPAPEASAEPKFKPGDRVQFRDEIPSTSEPHWFAGVYVERLPDGGHAVKFGPHGHVIHCSDKEIRPALQAEGCEELVQKDAPQTKEELMQRIVDCNPANYKPRNLWEGLTRRNIKPTFEPHKATGEELAEMAEEEGHG